MEQQRDAERRRRNVIITGMHETNKINKDDRYTDDLRSLKQIFRRLKCEFVQSKIVWVSRLGVYKPEKRGSRVLRIVFENEQAAGVLLNRAPRLAEDYLLAHIYIKEDESREERQRKWMGRRGDTSREAEQGIGNRGMASPSVRTGRVVPVSSATSTENLVAAPVVTPATQTRPRNTQDNQNVAVLEEADNDVAEDSSSSEIDFMDFITMDEVSESESESESERGSENESESDSVSDSETEEVTTSFSQVDNSRETMRINGEATIRAALEVMGLGEASILGQELTQSSVDEAIGRLLEATSTVAAQRRTQSGNYQIGGKQKGD